MNLTQNTENNMDEGR